MFLRITLGVSKRSSRWAILKETGQDPLTLPTMINMVKYWNHLVFSRGPILKEVLKVNQNLDSCGYKSWFTSIKNIFRFLKMDYILYTNDVVDKNILTK